MSAMVIVAGVRYRRPSNGTHQIGVNYHSNRNLFHDPRKSLVNDALFFGKSLSATKCTDVTKLRLETARIGSKRKGAKTPGSGKTSFATEGTAFSKISVRENGGVADRGLAGLPLDELQGIERRAAHANHHLHDAAGER
jgi:hypothetical protein